MAECFRCNTAGESSRTFPYWRQHRSLWLTVAVAVAIVCIRVDQGNALPTFARQTGLACSACHNNFPELTAMGRTFKAHGYTTLAVQDALEEKGTDKQAPLYINRTFPLSVMFQTSFTRTNDKQPSTQNNDVEFPQQLSIFLAGEITPHIGAFLQATYNGQDDKFSLDNTDFRFSDETKVADRELLYGVTLNNNPTVEDLWHTTAAWRWPFASADSAPTPDATALVDGVLAQQVAGLGLYGMWDKHLYADVSLYRSAHIGSTQPPGADSTSTISDVSPYWRLAWQQNFGPNYLEVGTFGMFSALYPTGTSGSTDKYTDFAFDTQYERPLGSDSMSAHATYIYENQQLDATHGGGGSDNLNDKLHTFRVDGVYHLQSRFTFSLGGFLTRGTNDKLLHAPPSTAPGDPAAVTGSINGSPDNDGVVAEIAYYPWQNVRFSTQYVAYTEFNGRANNYNGTGRNAVDNNTLYVLAWLNY